jgi:nucleoid DNA-binding protein
MQNEPPKLRGVIKEPRKVRNPETGEPVSVPGRKVVRCKQGPKLKLPPAYEWGTP